MVRDELVIQLNKPIDISIKGDIERVEILNVFYPSMKGFRLYSNIKAIVTKAMFTMQNQINQNDSINNQDDEESTDSFPLDLFLATDTHIELSDAINKYLIKFAKFDEFEVNQRRLEKLSIHDYNTVLERVSYFLYQI